MKTNYSGETTKGMLWSGRAISWLCVLFLLFDAVTKIMLNVHSVEGTVALGFPVYDVRHTGIALLFPVLLYAYPRTAILGAIFLTGYLGGAVSLMVRLDHAAYFPLILGTLIWLGLYLQDEELRDLIPIHKAFN